jgi:putative ABC transport system permease protein
LKVNMRDDLRTAIRTLRASKTFAAVAISVLALGIGATTAIFSLVDAVVLRALPFNEPDRLVAVGERTARAVVRPGDDPQTVSIFAPQNYLDVAASQRVFDSIAAIASGTTTLVPASGEPEGLRLERVTSAFFRVLRSYPVHGNTFTVDHEVEGRNHVCVLSDALWRRRFASDPTIVGQTIPLADGAYTVVGVMGPDFVYPVGLGEPAELWVPYVVPPNERARVLNTRSWSLQSIARLKPGVSLTAAQADLDRIAADMRRANPEWNKTTLVGARPLRDHIVDGRTTHWMLLLLGAVGLVLLIACANVASLLLARANTREREIGVRAALGASRWQLIRQLLVESLVLSVLGTLAAMVISVWGVDVLKQAVPAAIPRVATIAVNGRALGLAAVLAVVTGLLFGIVPALQLSRPDLTRPLRDHARGSSTGRGGQRFRGALIVIEVALAVVLLVGAALFIGSFRTVMGIDLGFSPDHVLTASLQPRVRPLAPGAPAADYSPLIGEVVGAIGRAPGVLHAALIFGGTPIVGRGFTAMSTPWGISIGLRHVTPDYFATMAIPLREGRVFSADDRSGAVAALILNESAARQYFAGQNPIGLVVNISGPHTIVGVVGDVRTNLEIAPAPEAYVPVAQGQATSGDLVVRTSGDPYLALPYIRAAVQLAFPDAPLRSVRSLDDTLADRVGSRRFNMMLLSLLGGLGLLIAAVGIYGLLAYLVAQREREIGVRIALGATRPAVIGLVIGRASLLVGLGLVIGGAGAYALGGTAKAFLFRMQVTDPRAFAAAVGVLVLAALLATIIPALRAASVDPIIALRSE